MKIQILPVVVVPDMSPLIHLAAAALLQLLHEFGRVVVMDMVAHEASDDLTKPWAREVAEWLRMGQKAGCDRPVEIAKTDIGEAYRLARQANPDFTMRNSGDRAIRDWLVDTLPQIGRPALVVYEDKRLPALIQREPLEEVVIMATTRAVLDFAEERSLIASAEEAWNAIITGAEGANPSRHVRVMRPTRAP